MSVGHLMVRRFSLKLEDYSGGEINSIFDSIGRALHLGEGFGRNPDGSTCNTKAEDIRKFILCPLCPVVQSPHPT